MLLEVNGQPQTLDGEQPTVADLLRRFDLAPIRVAVELNKNLVPRAQYDNTQLHDGDRLEIVTLVGGG